VGARERARVNDIGLIMCLSSTADGVVRGSYSYVDANGAVQSVNYISDALGFRAVGTNIPTTDAEDAVMTANVAYAHLPYAFDHPYYY
jgi:hypothetical protein